MKRISLLFAIMLCLFALGFAQTPTAFKYQAVARDNSGAVLQNQLVGVEIALLQGSVAGTVVYTESHTVTTNDFGLINLEIGNGQVVSGSFAGIDWANGAYFIQVGIDLLGGTNYTTVGTSQLLSVPYALFAQSSGDGYNGVSDYDQLAIDTMQANSGDLVYNSTSGCLNYYSGTNWLEFCNEEVCQPFPTTADAGPDSVLLTNSLDLLGNTPVDGVGAWSIIAGPGGSFSDLSSPNATFTGFYNQNYILEWSITNNCGVSSDWVAINFINCDDGNECTEDFYDPIAGCSHQILFPDEAIAGLDQFVYGDSTVLNANVPIIGEGKWEKVAGPNGMFTNFTSNTSSFVGETNAVYKLAWVISNCGYTKSDTVEVEFYDCNDNDPCTIDSHVAGTDSCSHVPVAVTMASVTDTLNIYNDTVVALSANAPQANEFGYWTIASGTNGALVDSFLINSEFIGSVNTMYELVWHIESSDLCGSSTDTMVVHFFNCDDNDPCTDDIYDATTGLCSHPLKDVTPAFAGTDIYANGDTVVLQATAVDTTFETGMWSVVGASPQANAPTPVLPGSFSNMYDPEATFYGSYNVDYFLRWTVSSPCAPNTTASVSVLLSSCDDNDPCTSDYLDSLNNCHNDTILMTQANIVEEGVVVTGTEAILHANAPVDNIGVGIWQIISGNGGTLSTPTNDSTFIYGVQGETYVITWSIVHDCQTSVDTVQVHMIEVGDIVCGYPFTDTRDQQVYPTVVVGDQCWMGANLNYGQMINSNTASVQSGDIGEKYCYNNDTNNCISNGGLYSWDELMNYGVNPAEEPAQGLCPVGWRVPSDLDWYELETHLDSTVATDPNAFGTGFRGTTIFSELVGATNDLYFTLGGRYNTQLGQFIGTSSTGYYWTSSDWSNGFPVQRRLSGSQNGVYRGEINKTYFYASVRCVKSEIEPCNPPPSIADAGEDKNNIMGTTVELAANTPTEGTGTWTVNIASGSFSNDTIPNAVFSGEAGIDYVLYWTITNECTISTGISSVDSVQINFFDTATFVCGESIIDARDQRTYNTIDMGNGQCWFNENLNIGSMISASVAQTDNDSIEKYCYQGDSLNCETRGGLYSWNEVMDYGSTDNGICPVGWKVASDGDWYSLESFLDSSINDPALVGYRGDSIGQILQEGGSSGFNLQFTGWKKVNQTFNYLTTFGSYWTSTEASGLSAYNRTLYPTTVGGSGMGRLTHSKTDYHLAVRCIQAEGNPCPTPTVAFAGDDQEVVGANATVLTADEPVNAAGEWTVDAGTNFSFTATDAFDAGFSGAYGQLYRLIWTASGPCGTAVDTVQIMFVDTTPVNPNCGQPIIDEEGNSYGTVQIGDQCWMSSNLRVGSRIDGNVAMTDNTVAEKYCYDNDTANCTTNGGLYSWAEAMKYQTGEAAPGLCPTGWHIPTDYEWFILESHLDATISDSLATGPRGTDAGTQMVNGTLGLTYSGYQNLSPIFDGQNSAGYYWSSTNGGASVWRRYISQGTGQVSRDLDDAAYGFSVRCIKDDSLTTPCFPMPSEANAGTYSDPVYSTSFNLSAVAPEAGHGIGAWTLLNSTLPGIIADAASETSQFTGEVGGTYTLVWSVTTTCDVSSDTVSFTIFDPMANFTCGDVYIDVRDNGKEYETALMTNGQCWFTENLNYGVMVDSSVTMSQAAGPEKYCYNNDPAICDVDGALYSWQELMAYEPYDGSQGLCPEGWHIPTDNDWYLLESSLDQSVNNPDSIGWRGTVIGTKFKSGPASVMDMRFSGSMAYGNYAGRWFVGHYWTSSLYSSGAAFERVIVDTTEQVQRESLFFNYALAARCIKDDGNTPCSPPASQANAGDDQLGLPNITTTTALNAELPQFGTGIWTITGGTGGSLADSSAYNTTFTGVQDVVYTLTWTVSTVCGSTSDDMQVSFSSLNTFTCGTDNLIDVRDGQSYATVEINGQCWMAENLNHGLALNSSIDQLDNDTIEKYCYDDVPSNCTSLGGLYIWDEVMSYGATSPDSAICPTGWHIPSDLEWSAMENYLDPSITLPETILNWRGTDIGTKLKVGGSSGLECALFGYYAGNFYGFQSGVPTDVNYWTSTEWDSVTSIKRLLSGSQVQAKREDEYKTNAFYVRCIED